MPYSYYCHYLNNQVEKPYPSPPLLHIMANKHTQFFFVCVFLNLHIVLLLPPQQPGCELSNLEGWGVHMALVAAHTIR